MSTNIISKIKLGDMSAVYFENNGVTSLLIVPCEKENDVLESKLDYADSLVQVYVDGDTYYVPYARGISMRNSESSNLLKFKEQKKNISSAQTDIITYLEREDGQRAVHHLIYDGGRCFRSYSEYINGSKEQIIVKMLSSFSISALTPFIEGEAPESLVMHRLRSYWSAEGRLESCPVEHYQLDPSWSKWAQKSERFGQIGTLPVRHFFPFVAVEDIKNDVTWAAKIAWAGSWQIEPYRQKDVMSLSGGLADYEFGHWAKRLEAGESIVTPEAILTVSKGGFEEVSQRLLDADKRFFKNLPQTEQQLPLPAVYNEYCDTWGTPTHDKVMTQLENIRGLGFDYFVIDAGWYDDADWASKIGDWNVSNVRFPDINKTVEAINKEGLTAGLWFEYENCGVNSDASKTYRDKMIKLHGKEVMASNRLFWDFTNPEVCEYLHKKVIEFLKETGFRYIKVDYNETFGIGCDGDEFIGEALRRQVLAMTAFYKSMTNEIPDLVVENCSSGGHRLEPMMMSMSSMASFSDAHECVEIPIIAANLHYAILPSQSQIWAVLRPEDTEKRTIYTLVNTFLGRMGVSGPIAKLSDRQRKLLKESIALHKEVSHIIKNGRSKRYGTEIKAYGAPKGFQAMVRIADDQKSALVVFNSFSCIKDEFISIKNPAFSKMNIAGTFAETGTQAVLDRDILTINFDGEYSGAAIYLKD